jgi:hypothetical protein
MVPTADPATPFEGIFPPRWRLGDAWRVVMTTDVPGNPIRDMPPDQGDLAFECRVAQVPASPSGLARVDADCPDSGLRYRLFYRVAPFAFVRLTDAQGRGLPLGEPENPPGAPYVGASTAITRFITDCPVMPTDGQLGSTEYTVLGQRSTQHVRRVAAGLEFVITRHTLRVTIVWEPGRPFWTSLDREIVSLPGFSIPPPRRDGAGRLA